MYDLDEAYEQGYTLVYEANRYSDDVTRNETLVTLAMHAVLYELGDQWIIDMLSVGCERNIDGRLTRVIRH